jgi:hypothetical protein
MLPGLEVTVYDVIALSPAYEGAVNDTTPPAVALPIVGAAGTWVKLPTVYQVLP